MARRKNASTVIALLGMPWWISGLLAVAAFYIPEIVGHLFPVGQGEPGSVAGQAIVSASKLLSPFLATALLLVALIVLVKDRWQRRKSFATGDISPAGQASSVLPKKPLLTMTPPDSATVAFAADEAPVPPGWSIALLQSIEWKRFEALCEALFNELNLLARNTQFGPDGGIDIELYDKHAPDTMVAIAQCKAWEKPVGVSDIREFYGVMIATRISRAYFVTTSSFTPEAVVFSRMSKVTLISGDILLKLIASLTDEKSAALLKLATAGDYTTPTCPGCGLKMVRRVPTASGAPFWGCLSYPRCKGKLDMKKAG